MTLFYKKPEDIEYSEENPDVVNVNETCQHCGNINGYTVIGKVDAVKEDEADKYEGAGEEDELNLDFGDPTEEVSPEGTGGGLSGLAGEDAGGKECEKGRRPCRHADAAVESSGQGIREASGG